MTRLLAVPLDASDVFLMTFMILQDSYMEPTRVGSDIVDAIKWNSCFSVFNHIDHLSKLHRELNHDIETF